jgi:hypothetical protein
MAMNKKVFGLVALDRVKHIHQSVNSKDYYSITEPFVSGILESLSAKIDIQTVSQEIQKKKIQTLSYYECALKGII